MAALISGYFRALFASRERGNTRTAFGGKRQRPVVVYTAVNVWDAELAKALLDSEGIPAYVIGESLGRIYGMHTGALAEMKVIVGEALAPRARQIIEERHLGTPPVENNGDDD